MCRLLFFGLLFLASPVIGGATTITVKAVVDHVSGPLITLGEEVDFSVSFTDLAWDGASPLTVVWSSDPAFDGPVTWDPGPAGTVDSWNMTSPIKGTSEYVRIQFGETGDLMSITADWERPPSERDSVDLAWSLTGNYLVVGSGEWIDLGDGIVTEVSRDGHSLYDTAPEPLTAWMVALTLLLLVNRHRNVRRVSSLPAPASSVSVIGH